VQLQWHKCGTAWCLLREVDLPSVDQHGVFILWRDGDPRRAPAVLYVGRGALREQLERCRRDPLFHGSPALHVTWAKVDDARDTEAIAAYLYRELRPIWGEVVPSLHPVPVNLPLSA
jgi:hypothetical protein